MITGAVFVELYPAESSVASYMRVGRKEEVLLCERGEGRVRNTATEPGVLGRNAGGRTLIPKLHVYGVAFRGAGDACVGGSR